MTEWFDLFLCRGDIDVRNYTGDNGTTTFFVDHLTGAVTLGSAHITGALTVDGLVTFTYKDVAVDAWIKGDVDIDGGIIVLDNDETPNVPHGVSLTSKKIGAGAVSIISHNDTDTTDTIVIQNVHGVNVASVDVKSTVGGLTFTSGLSSADAINIYAVATGGGGGIDIDSGTHGIALNTTGTLTLGSVAATIGTTGAMTWTHSGGAWTVNSTSQNITLATITGGNIILTGAGILDADFVGASHIFVATGGLDIRTTGSGDLDILSVADLDMDGATVNLNSAGALIIGSTTAGITTAGAVTWTHSVGQWILNSTSQNVALNTVGGGNIVLNSAAMIDMDAAANMDLDVTGWLDIDVSAALNIDSAGALSLQGAQDSDLTVSGTSAGALVLTLASENAGAGTGVVNINAKSTIALGAATTPAIDINGGAVTIDGASLNIGQSAALSANWDFTTFDMDATGAIDINSSAAGFDISGVTASGVNVTGAGIDLTLQSTGGSVNITATEADAQSIYLLSSAGGIQLTAQALYDVALSGGQVLLASLDNVANGISLDATTGGIVMACDLTFDIHSIGAITIDSDTSIAIGTDADHPIDIDASTLDIDCSGAFTLDSTSFSIDGTVASNISTTNANLTMSTLLSGTLILNGVAAVTVDAGTTMSFDCAGVANFTSSAGDVDIRANGASLNLISNEAVADSIVIGANAGGIDITAPALFDVDISGGQINLVSSDAGAASIFLDAASVSAAGGIDVNAGTGGISLDTTGTLNIGDAAAVDGDFNFIGWDIDASGNITLDADNFNIGQAADLGIDINAIAFTLDASGAISLDSTAAINVTVTGVFDLKLNSTGATVDIDGVDFTIDATTTSGITVTGVSADLNLGSVGGSVNVTATEAVANAIYLNSTAGGIDVDALTTLTLDAGTSISIGTTANHPIDINASTFDVDCTGGALTLDSDTSISIGVLADHPITIEASTFDVHASGAMTIDSDTSIAIGTDSDKPIDVDASTFDVDASGAMTLDSATSIHVGTTAGGIEVKPADNNDINLYGTVRRTKSYFEDDFWGGAVKPQWNSRVGTGAFATSNLIGGARKLTTGAGATNEQSYDFNDDFNYSASRRPTFEFGVKLTQVDDDTEVYIGLVDSLIAADYENPAANGSEIIMARDLNEFGTNWHLVSEDAAGAGPTSVDLNVAPTTDLVMWRVVFTTDSSATAYYSTDGLTWASAGTIAATMPATAMQPVISIRTHAGVAKAMDIDYFFIQQDRM